MVNIETLKQLVPLIENTKDEVVRKMLLEYLHVLTHTSTQTQPSTRSVETYKGCTVCNLGAVGKVMGYVCQRSDCPTKITCQS